MYNHQLDTFIQVAAAGKTVVEFPGIMSNPAYAKVREGAARGGGLPAPAPGDDRQRGMSMSGRSDSSGAVQNGKTAKNLDQFS